MPETYTTRHTLLIKAKDQHDSQAWEEFIAAYKNYIYIIIRNMNINPHDTDDIMQMITVKLWKALPEYDYVPGKHKFRNWVSRITRNEVINFVRRQKSLAARMDIAAQDATLSYLDDIQLPEVDDIAENEWRTFITNMALQNTKKHFKGRVIEAFTMHFKGVSIAEIAKELDLKEASVYKYIARFKSRLIDETAILKKEFSL